MKKWIPISLMMGLMILVLVGCGGQDSSETSASPASADAPYTVAINPADFVAGIDNPYFPLVLGARHIFEGEVEDGLERIEVEVLAETKPVMSVTTTIVRDTVYLNGEIIEDTYDWYVQDKEGNVWYFGEDSKEYEDGEVVSAAGSWEAGVDGALPGIIMYADPAAHTGETYRQEYYQGEAEDMAQVLSVNESVAIPFGSFDHVLQTLETTPLEPDVREHKFYAEGIGLIQEINLETGETVLLVEVVMP